MSTIKTNTLTGTTSAGSIVVTGEGGSTTTNLQQGLAKAWMNMAAGMVEQMEVLIYSALTDNGTGDYTITMLLIWLMILCCTSHLHLMQTLTRCFSWCN